MKPQDRTRAILRSTLDAECRLVAIALADHMDVHDEAYPSVGTLATETALSERTVQDVIRHGLAHRWVQARGTNGGRRTLTILWAYLTAEHPSRKAGVEKKANPRTRRTGAPLAPVRPAHPPPPHAAHPSPAPGAPVPPHAAHPMGAPGAPEACTDEATTEPPRGGPVPVVYLDPFEDPNDPFYLPPEDRLPAQPTPAPRPPVAPVAPPQRAKGPTRPSLPPGVPSDLPALLSAGPGHRGGEVDGLTSVGRISVIPYLLAAGIEDAEMLLSIAPERLQYQPVKDAVVLRLRAHLRARWGLELGCLAEAVAAPEPEAPPPPIIPGAPQYPHESGYLFAVRRENERRSGIRPLTYFPEAANG
jgi:hypothetical protein